MTETIHTVDKQGKYRGFGGGVQRDGKQIAPEIPEEYTVIDAPPKHGSQRLINGKWHDNPNDYIRRRAENYPESGDQLDAAYKDRVARQLAAGKARKAVEAGDLEGAVNILINAIDAGDDADQVDAKITAVKRAIPKGKKA